MHPGCVRLGSGSNHYQLYALGQVLQLLWALFPPYTGDKISNHHRKDERRMWVMCKSLKSTSYRANAISMSLVLWLADLLGAANFCCLWVFLRFCLSSVPLPAWLTQSLLRWVSMALKHPFSTSQRPYSIHRSTVLTDNGLMLKSDSCEIQAFLPRCGSQDCGWGKNMGLPMGISGLELKCSVLQCFIIWDLAHLALYNVRDRWDIC